MRAARRGGPPAMTAAPLDLVIKNVRVVRPAPAGRGAPRPGRAGRPLRADRARHCRRRRRASVFDGRGLLGFPGVVDAHTHVGIYAPLSDDAVSESKAAAAGGVTTMLTYFRTGQYYLNRGGPYAEFFPEVLRLSEGRYWVDYGYHLAPIQASHVGEMEALAVAARRPVVQDLHVLRRLRPPRRRRTARTSSGASSCSARTSATTSPTSSSSCARPRRVLARHPALRDHVSVSLHCEVADILNAYTRLVQQDPSLTGLRAYSAARPAALGGARRLDRGVPRPRGRVRAT